MISSYVDPYDLLQVSRRFAKGKVSLEDYLFNLKEIAGISLLVGAVAIGNKKEDLTRRTINRDRKTRKKPTAEAWNSQTEDVKDPEVDTTIQSISSALTGETPQGTTEVGLTFTKSAGKADDGTRKAVLSTLCKDKETSTEKPKSWPLIDLNQPYPSPGCGTNEPLTDDVHSSSLDSSLFTETKDQFELLNSSNDATGEEQPVVKGRRQSSRSRELTTKALEAIALDLLGPKKRRKSMNSSSSMADNVHSEIHCSSYLSETHHHLELHSNDATGEVKPGETCQRQSSRSRQMTTKALEAIALDFLGPKERRKSLNSLSRSRYSPKVHQKTGTATLPIDVAFYRNQETEHSDINVNSELPK